MEKEICMEKHFPLLQLNAPGLSGERRHTHMYTHKIKHFNLIHSKKILSATNIKQPLSLL